MGKQIIDLIGELVSISGNSTIDGIIFAIIGSIAASVAFGFVGLIFNAIGFYDSDLMSDANEVVRVLVFISLTWAGVKIAQAVKWLFGFQWWIYVVAGIIFVGIIILVYYIKHRISKSKVPQVIPVKESNPEVAIPTEEKIEPTVIMIERKYYCPRCHSRLVKRHGPYGDFYGCESYGKTGCRYTRKFL